MTTPDDKEHDKLLCERLATTVDHGICKCAERHRIAELEAELAAERELSEAREGLQAGRDLMAVVHGDGGHYREQYGDRKASEDAIAIVGALRVAYADALAALTPFAHADLCKALGGNAEGDTSRIFVRNSAVITLGDCRRARAIVVASETDRTSAVEGAHRAYLQAAADAAAIDS